MQRCASNHAAHRSVSLTTVIVVAVLAGVGLNASSTSVALTSLQRDKRQLHPMPELNRAQQHAQQPAGQQACRAAAAAARSAAGSTATCRLAGCPVACRASVASCCWSFWAKVFFNLEQRTQCAPTWRCEKPTLKLTQPSNLTTNDERTCTCWERGQAWEATICMHASTKQRHQC